MLNFKAAPSISNNNPSKGCNEHTHTHTQWRTGTTRANTFAPSGVGLGRSSRVGAVMFFCPSSRERHENNRKEGRGYPGRGLAHYPSHGRGEEEGSLVVVLINSDHQQAVSW